MGQITGLSSLQIPQKRTIEKKKENGTKIFEILHEARGKDDAGKKMITFFYRRERFEHGKLFRLRTLRISDERDFNQFLLDF